MAGQPLSDKDLRTLIRRALGPQGMVFFVDHAELRMEERDIDEQLVRRVLVKGCDDGCDPVGTEWRYRRRLGHYVVVIEVDPPSSVIVVTTIDIRRP